MHVRLTALIVLLGCVLAVPAAADQWSKSYALSGKPDLWVSTGDGSVRIDVWDEPRIEARLETVGYEINKDFQLIESQSGNQVKIETKFPSGNWGLNIGHRALTLTLTVPRVSNLDLHTGDGSMTLNGARGDIRLNTGDGRIEATGVDGRLTASSGDGRIIVEGRFDLLDLHSGDGSVEAAAKPGSTIGAPWSVKTGDGPVTLRLPDDFKANIEARTGDGTVTLDLPVTVSGSVTRAHVQGALNGGGGALTVRTGDGSIRLGRY